MARWITDGSDGFSVNEAVVIHVHNNQKGDNVFNAMWKDGDGVSSGKHYWKIHFPTLIEGAGVGLTSTDHFHKGYECKALKYLGNLSDGSCLLVSDFGPRPKEGDDIGILADFEGDRLKVYIDVNGESLGLAFNVPATTFDSIYPMVSFKKSGSVTCTKQKEIPDITKRAPAVLTGIEGDWRLTSLQEKEDKVNFPRMVTAKITKTETEEYTWNVKVLNYLRTTFTIADAANGNSRDVTASRKSDNRESMEEDRAVERLTQSAKTFEVNESGKLVVKTDTMTSIWVRFDDIAEPFVGEPFA